MKILSIRVKNLASLEGVTELNFTQEPLSSAGIFAITGPTGAGKSTILDGLCLALYGKTPRYLQAKESGIEITNVQGNAITQGDVRGILRDGTGEGYAEVDFVGVDGQQYRATWRVRRARDRADGSLQAFSVTLKNISTNTDIPGRKTELQDEIERLVGLNFEQFTRSVLLAQGDFTAFLKAAKDEKSALLEKLTGTHIYSEISKQIFANCKKEERDLEDLHLQRAGISTLTSEEVEAFDVQSVTIKGYIAGQEKEIEVINREITWHTHRSTLESSLGAADLLYKQANESKQSAINREQKLWYIEQVQPTKIWVDNQQIAKNLMVQKATELQQLQTTHISLLQKNDELNLQQQQINEDVANKIQKQENAAPLLAEARSLDVQINGKTEQVNLAANEVLAADQHYKHQEKQIRVQKEQADELLSTVNNLKQWKDENSARQLIPENYNLISSKLSDASRVLGALKLLSPQLENTRISIENTKRIKLDLELKAVSIVQVLQTERELHATASLTLSSIPIASLEGEKVVIDLVIGDIIAAEANWKILFNSQVDLALSRQNLTENRNELNSKLKSLDKTVEQLVVVTAERTTSLLMVNKARLAAADNVDTLRSQLIAGDHCPVCGSVEHPYVSQHPQFDHILQELEIAHERYEKAYATCLAIESSLKEACSQLKKIIAAQEKEILTKEAVLQGHKGIWERSTTFKDASIVPDEDKTVWLAELLQSKRTKQQDLQNQIQSYAGRRHELDKLRDRVNDLDKELNENSNLLKDAQRNIESLQEQWSQYNKEQLTSNKALSDTERELTAYFSVHDWFDHWKSDPAQFLKRIGDFSELWKANVKKLDEHTQQYGLLSATLKGLQEQLQNFLADLQKKRIVLAGLKEQQEALMQKRKGIFNGEAAATIELNLKQATSIVQQRLEKCKAERDKLQTDITRVSTQKEQAEKDIASLRHQDAVLGEKIIQWILEINNRHNLALDTNKILQLLEFSPDWVGKERNALRTIDDAVTQALSVLHERTAQLQLHEQQRLSERNADELKILLDRVKTDLQQNAQRKNEISFLLQQDVANKQRIGNLLGLIEAKALVVDNWAKLNEIVGSADGKKFRQIAQEHTLDVLLKYANTHLEMLSNRYLLQRIPNTLGLQIVDQDMGDELRTVYSLSGGESFLVSLALALGLASLSSSRMQVESLFIDEGFGSLDPATLNIAMDALERLHNQGRKVGVISHVQEMTERIPVQIKVSKKSSGKSIVELIAS